MFRLGFYATLKDLSMYVWLKWLELLTFYKLNEYTSKMCSYQPVLYLDSQNFQYHSVAYETPAWIFNLRIAFIIIMSSEI